MIRDVVDLVEAIVAFLRRPRCEHCRRRVEPRAEPAPYLIVRSDLPVNRWTMTARVPVCPRCFLIMNGELARPDAPAPKPPKMTIRK